MRALLFIFTLAALSLRGQTDKVFMINGEIKKGQIRSAGTDFVFFRQEDSAAVSRIAKSKIVLIEKYDGKIITYRKEVQRNDSGIRLRKFRNSLGIHPFGVFVGRLSGSYEYLLADGKLGVMLPFSLTFDPVGVIYAERNDSDRVRLHRPGLNAIGGLDLNFYVGTGEFEGFFIGPRLRYGVDMLMSNIEGYSLQTQVGYKLAEGNSRIVQHVSAGFGFVRVLSSPAGNRINPKQSYGWVSINYRLGIRW